MKQTCIKHLIKITWYTEWKEKGNHFHLKENITIITLLSQGNEDLSSILDFWKIFIIQESNIILFIKDDISLKI